MTRWDLILVFAIGAALVSEGAWKTVSVFSRGGGFWPCTVMFGCTIAQAAIFAFLLAEMA